MTKISPRNVRTEAETFTSPETRLSLSRCQSSKDTGDSPGSRPVRKGTTQGAVRENPCQSSTPRLPRLRCGEDVDTDETDADV